MSKILINVGDAISPLDGRYNNKTKDLSQFFSERAYVSYRKNVEEKYFYFLCTILPELKQLKSGVGKNLGEEWKYFYIDLTDTEFNMFKELENTLHHDVKSIEYMVKNNLEKGLKRETLLSNAEISSICEFVHFGLTSEDINSTSMMLMVKDSINFMKGQINDLLSSMQNIQDKCNIPSLAFTHGQPATPILLSNIFKVYKYRITKLTHIKPELFSCKFGGATGTLAAHKIAYPDINWEEQMNIFISDLGLNREEFTTQISNYDDLSMILNQYKQLCTVLKDMCVDLWLYISRDYFIQTKPPGAVGSSTMPHKTNPINFENAEGNFKLGINAFEFFSRELPVSRLHRDLTGSTVVRNIGVPFGHMLVGIQSLIKGLSTIEPNVEMIRRDLNDHWEVITEAYQTILRKEGYDKPYEALKTLSNKKLTQDILHLFVDGLGISEDVKVYMKTITPHNYYGK